MRKIIARTAVATLCAGSSDSAAAMVTSSIPPKAKATASKPAAKPGTPLGAKFSTKLLVWVSAGPKMSHAPSTKKATMTATLMMANQNSNSPNPRTAPKLTTAKNTTATSAGIHGSTPNQPPRIAAAPVISAPITIISMNQYNQPIVKRAQLPNA